MATEIKNIGVSRVNEMPEQWEGLIIFPRSLTDTLANFALQSYWQDKIVAALGSRAYLFPIAIAEENTDEEDVYETTSLRHKLQVAKGKYSHKFHFGVGLSQHRAIQTFNDTEWGAGIYDTNGKILFTFSNAAETEAKGLRVKVFAEKMKRNDGSIKSKSVISVTVLDSNDIDKNGFLVDGAFFSNLIPLTSVKLAVVGSPSATSYTISVINPNDGTGIVGLVAADFTMLSGATGLTDNDDGTYTFAGTGMATGPTNLKAASALSIKAYESLGAVTVTI
jgi:hypothetical protein